MRENYPKIYAKVERPLNLAIQRNDLIFWLRLFLLGLIAIVFLLGYVLSAIALWFHMPEISRTYIVLGIVAIGLFLTGTATVSKSHCVRLFGLAVIPLISTLYWWTGISPSNDRNWVPELAETLKAKQSGSIVVLKNVRNFTWRSETDFDAAWEDWTVDLEELESIDAALSHWGLHKIAHVLVSFGFTDGQHVVFSVEIRREEFEAFSELGGLFKQYELSLIAASEEDILYLRTNARTPKEDVYLYPIKVDAKARQELFLSYLRLANKLSEKPLWYNTITANCTTMIYRLVRGFSPDQHFDIRFLLPGGLPEYFAENDLLLWEPTVEDYRQKAAISAKAQAIQPGQSYSQIIRKE